MTTLHENAAKLLPTVAQMDAQLTSWAMQLDELVAGRFHPGARSRDAYRDRLAELRVRHGVAQAKLDEYTHPTGPRAA